MWGPSVKTDVFDAVLCHAATLSVSVLEHKLELLCHTFWLRFPVQLCESRRPAWYLQPILLIVVLLPFDKMEGVYYPSLLARILFALVQDVSVYQDQTPRLDLSKHVFLLRVQVLFVVKVLRPLRILGDIFKRCARSVCLSHKSLPDWRSSVTPGRKAQTAIVHCRVFESDPESYR